MENNQKKTRLRAPPRSVELVSTLDKIKVNQRLGEQKHYFYVRITFIITDIISLGLGIYILIKYDDLLNKDYNFRYRTLLLSFIYIYSPSAIGIFFLSLFLSLIIYTFFLCCEKEKIYGAPLYDENDISLSLENLKEHEDTEKKESENKDIEIKDDEIKDNESKDSENKDTESKDSQNKINENKKKDEYKEPRIKEEYIGVNADKVTFFPYTMTIFIILTIAFYFIALPLSIILLVKLWNDDVYQDKEKFWPLYAFISTNLINGILIVVVFLHMFIVKRKENSILKKNMEINENKITEYRNEVREALKNAK
jgi:hypothetical protein